MIFIETKTKLVQLFISVKLILIVLVSIAMLSDELLLISSLVLLNDSSGPLLDLLYFYVPDIIK